MYVVDNKTKNETLKKEQIAIYEKIQSIKELVSQYERDENVQLIRDAIDIYVNQQIDVPYIDTEFRQCIGSGYMKYYSAKKCALIAVDEILKVYELLDEDADIMFKTELNYWQEVKKEIEKL
jgi:oligoribonuclease NrnB/cAMP/cGMP phosphodiesterase (DHH superfamily)